MTSQLRVKSRAVFPYTYTGADGLPKKSPNLGTEQMAFEQYVDPSGNTWVTLANGLTGTSPSGSIIPIITDGLGNLSIAMPNTSLGTAPLNSVSIAYENSRIVKVGAGVVFGVSGYNSKSSAQFIQLFDFGGPGVPPDGAAPVGPPISVSATSNYSIDFGYWGMAFAAGMVITNSSTGPTKTIGSADTWFAVRYK